MDTNKSGASVIGTLASPGRHWEALWFSTRQTPWTSLALVPSDVGVDVAGIASRLIAAGKLHGERPIHLVDAQGLGLSEIKPVLEAIADAAARGEWVIVAVDPIFQNPSSIPIARAASHALLLVQLGQSLVSSSHEAIKAIGRERFVGAVTLDESLQAA